MSDPLEHNDFEERLKKAAEDFLPKPSHKVWENIRDELHPRKRIYLLAAAAAILLLVATGVYFLQKQYSNSGIKPSLAEQAAPAISPAQAPSALSNHSPLKEPNANQSAEPKALSGKISTGNQKSKEAEKNGYRYAESFTLTKGSKQVSNSKIENQSVKEPGLSYLKNLSVQFNSSTILYGENQAVCFPLQNKNYISSTSPLTSPAEEQFNQKKKEKVAQKKLHRKSSFEIFYTPSIGYRTLTKGSSGMMASGSSSYLNQVNSSSSISKLKQQPEWSWTAGARIAFPFGKTWSLQTGLSVAELNYRVSAYGTYPVYVQNSNSYYAANPSRPVSNLSTNAFAVSAAARPALDYLHNSYVMGEIPLLITKQFGNSHGVTFNMEAGAGLSYIIHSNPVIYSPSSGRYFNDSHYIRSVNGNFHIEPSVLIPLSSHLKLDVGPSFQYQILSSYKNYLAVKEHPYLIGLKTGLQLVR